MKKLLFAGFMLLSIISNAQTNAKGDFTIAPQIGLAVSTYTASENVTFNYRTAFALGAGAEYYFNNRWSIRSGLFYAPMGAEDDFDTIDKLNYLSIPLNANWHFGSNRNWYLNFGLAGNILLSAKTEFSNGEEFDIEEAIKSGDIGFNAGIGYKFLINENTQLFADYQGYNGFVDIIDGFEFPYELRNASSTFNFGAIIKL